MRQDHVVVDVHLVLLHNEASADDEDAVALERLLGGELYGHHFCDLLTLSKEQKRKSNIRNSEAGRGGALTWGAVARSSATLLIIDNSASRISSCQTQTDSKLHSYFPRTALLPSHFLRLVIHPATFFVEH